MRDDAGLAHTCGFHFDQLALAFAGQLVDHGAGIFIINIDDDLFEFDIEMVKANLDGLLIEKSKSLSADKLQELKHELQRLIALKNILHLAYDGLYRWEMGESKPEGDGLMVLEALIEGLQAIDYTTGKMPEVLEIELPSSLKGDFSRSAVNFKWMALHFQELA